MSDPRGTARWKKLRRVKLARDPVCQICAIGIAVQVDHIEPLFAGGSMWDPRNHQSVCRPCHDRKNGREAKERMRMKEGR